MKRVTDVDIAEMRSRGYSSNTISEAEWDRDRTLIADDLCMQIEAAFTGVTLGDGIGLWEAQGLDDCESEETCAQYREGDEKVDWKAIHPDVLDRCSSSLSFFDAAGFRFHLPAFLIVELTVGTVAEMVGALVSESDFGQSRYELFSEAQRGVIRDFLLFARDDRDYSFQQTEIDAALSGYWRDDVR